MPLSLVLVDELIAARRNLHGGNPGAPRRLDDRSHEGRALNRACVVMLSSSLQAFVGEVFLACSEKAFGRKLNGNERKDYIATVNGGDKSGHAAAQNQASGGVASAMARALSR